MNYTFSAQVQGCNITPLELYLFINNCILYFEKKIIIPTPRLFGAPPVNEKLPRNCTFVLILPHYGPFCPKALLHFL